MDALRARRRRGTTVAITVVAVMAVAVAAWAVVGMFASQMTGASGTRAAGRSQESTGEAMASAGASTAVSPAVAPSTGAQDSTQTPSSTVVEIGWAGDLTPGSRSGTPPRQGKAIFENVRELLQAPDIMVANLEGTYGDGGPSKCDGADSSECYAFQASPGIASALPWAGIDVVNLANNHSNDYLKAGRASTRSALEVNGIDHTGLSGTMAIRKIDGVKVAFLGFAPYSWTDDLGDISAAQDRVAEASARADVVVVLMHAGAEGVDKTETPSGEERAYGEFRGNVREFSHAVIDAGADVVLGSGPHVIRGVERYNDKLIAYSLGNFAGWNNFNISGDRGLSAVLTVRITGDGTIVGGTWHSLMIEGAGVPSSDPKQRSLALVRKLSNADFDSPVDFNDEGDFEF